MTYRAQPPGPTQQEAAPALSEGVIWFVGQVRGSGKRRRESARGSGRVDVRGGRRSVLQHRLVALEHTLGNFWSSALQRHLRERESTDEQDQHHFTSTLVRRHAEKILTDKSMQKMPAVGHEALKEIQER